MNDRVVVLGGGHGLAAVAGALRDVARELTLIVTIADDGGSSGELRRRRQGPAVGDIRRSLIALMGDDVALARAFARPVTINRLGSHPLGNLVMRSLTDAFGDLETASQWLCEQLGITGRVLPASAEPVTLVGETDAQSIHGESAIGTAQVPIRRLRFKPERPKVPPATVRAIEQADWVLLAPGSLFTSVLSVCSLPDVAPALARTTARVVWICNLRSDQFESAGMTLSDHLGALRRHGVRVDCALFDPDAELQFRSESLGAAPVELLRRPLRGAEPGAHDSGLLRAALVQELFSESAGAVTAGRRGPGLIATSSSVRHAFGPSGQRAVTA